MSKWDDKLAALTIVPSAALDLYKSTVKKEDPFRAPRSYMENPLDVQAQLGFKDRRYSMTYDILKRIPYQLGVVAGIIQTRCNQVATFALPYRQNQGIGFRITRKDKQRESSPGEREFIRSMEAFICRCGQLKHNQHSDIERDGFETFLKKVVRDSLTYDQMTFEVVPDKKKRPYEFIAVDASTIRIAAPFFGSRQGKPGYTAGYTPTLVDPTNLKGDKPFTTLNPNAPFNERPAFVQLIDGKVVNVYSREELSFCIRNPRTDLLVQGYGFSELEMLVNTITSHLNAEAYNSVFFKQSSQPKGILNFKGDTMSVEQLEHFRRVWRDQMEGVQNFWRTPILQSEAGVEWINLHTNNRDMEYAQWLEYLIKVTCAVYQIDPAELNFDMHGGVQQTPLFESSQEWKLKASRDKGLRPLLRFIAEQVNKHIVQRIDDDYVFEFIGLDEPTEKEKHDMRKEQTASYLTLNEVRDLDDRPRLPLGDIPMNPVYLQAMTLEQQEKQGGGQPGAQPGKEGAPPAPGAEAGGQPPAGQAPPDDTNSHVPGYVDAYGMEA